MPPATETTVLLLLHNPPPVASLRLVVESSQIEVLPSIAVGCKFTVTIADTAQAPIVYEIIEVPTPIPVIRPPPVIVATVVISLVHTPPPVASDNNNVNVWQIGPVFPDIATGCVFTVTTRETEQLPMT